MYVAWVLCNRGRTEKLLLVRTILLNYSILLSSKSFRKHIVKDLAAKQNYSDTFKHQTDNKTLFLPIFNYLFFLGSGPGIRSLLGPSVDSNIKPDFRTKEKAEILHRKLQCTSTTCVFTYVTVEQKRVFKSHVEKDQRSPFLLRGDVRHQPGASETTISNYPMKIMKETPLPAYLLVHLALLCSYICLYVIKMTKCFPTFHINSSRTLWALGKQTKKGIY